MRPLQYYHGSRASSFNERPRPHTSRWNGSPVSSSSASRTAVPCGAFRFVPRPRGSAIDVSRVTNRVKAASRHFARRRTTSLSPNPAKLIVGVFARCWAARAHRGTGAAARRSSKIEIGFWTAHERIAWNWILDCARILISCRAEWSSSRLPDSA